VRRMLPLLEDVLGHVQELSAGSNEIEPPV
jgi:hypothetical protein